MKLNSISVQNYRSIDTTPLLRIQDSLTVILGPNNEGKSNLLRSIILGMECLKAIRAQPKLIKADSAEAFYRLLPAAYDWATDFPVALQANAPDGETILNLLFGLSDSECELFAKECGLAINGDLPLEIRVGQRGATFKVRKPGRGNKTYEKMSRQIARFVSTRFDFAYIPAIRPSELSLDIIGRLMDRELTALSNDAEYKKALKTIEDAQRPALESLAAQVQLSLKQLLPSVKKVKIAPAGGNSFRSRFAPPIFVIDDGTATKLEAKGDGVKSLIAISLMRAAKANNAAGDVLIAIEEPESHLHPLATREMAELLRGIADQHQVVITTHSPLLAVRGDVTANLIVQKSKALPAATIRQVREALGVQTSDNLTSAETVLLVEGIHDVTLLSCLLRRFSLKLAAKLDDGSLVVNDLEGTSKIAYSLSIFHAAVTNVILLVDDDKAGRDCLTKATKEAKLHEKYQFRWKRQNHVDTEMEDLISPSIYWELLQSTYGAILNRDSFESAKEKWSARMKQAFESSGKPWNSSVESNVKGVVASAVSAFVGDPVHPAHFDLVTNVFSAIEKLSAQ